MQVWNRRLHTALQEGCWGMMGFTAARLRVRIKEASAESSRHRESPRMVL